MNLCCVGWIKPFYKCTDAFLFVLFCALVCAYSRTQIPKIVIRYVFVSAAAVHTPRANSFTFVFCKKNMVLHLIFFARFFGEFKACENG